VLGVNLKQRVLKWKYPNFHWVMSWCITKVCNLRCTYCHYSYSPDYRHPDFEARIRTLLEVKPKHICINGGEPLTIPTIVDILKRLREGLGEHMQLEFNTNGTLSKMFHQILPYVNGVCLSIDGVGEFNKIYRGVDGDKLLDTLQEIVRYTPPPEQNFYIMVVPVATAETYPGLPKLIERVQEIWKNGNVPNIRLDIKVVFPSTHPLSITSKKDVWDDFIHRSIEWHERYDLPVTVRGLAPASHLTLTGDKRVSHCIRQYFNAILEEDGHITYCKPERYYDYFKECFLQGDFREKARSSARAINTLLINRFDADCYFPCDHGEFLDDILDSSQASTMAVKARKEGVILSRDDLEDACTFINEHFPGNIAMDFENLVWQNGRPFYSSEVKRDEKAPVKE